MGQILENALERIARPAIRSRRIARLRLHRAFSIVELDDRGTGAAMSYAGASSAERERMRRRFEDALPNDPLLLQTTASSEGMTELSLRAAIASALVMPAIRAGGDATFRASGQAPFSFFEGVRVAVVVGFGGYMKMLARRDGVEELHVLDFGYAARREKMDGVLARYRKDRPGLNMTISDDIELLRQSALRADVVCVTGSALCNGTLEGLLDCAKGCKRLIVQGQSAAIHPAELFRRGVGAVATTIKPPNLIDLADLDLLDSVLETDVSAVYLSPALC
jgi:Putative heavy-metal chelation